MAPFCDSTKNFITDKSYKQISLDSSITEDEARKQCMKHTFKNEAYEGKDFFFQQHGNGYTICGFFDDKIEDSDVKVKHGHTFGGICTIPEDVEIKLHIDDKVESVVTDVKKNTNEINLVRTINSSGLETIRSRLTDLEETLLAGVENNTNEINLVRTKNSSEIETMRSRLSDLEETVKTLQEQNINMATSIEDLQTVDDNMFESIEELEQEDVKLSNMLSKKNSCNRRKGWTGTGGHIRNFKKDGSNGLEKGMTIGDCVRIGKQNGWNFVGHRNGSHSLNSHKNTCWRHDSNYKQNERLEQWVKTDQGNDHVHTTVMLKENCSF